MNPQSGRRLCDRGRCRHVDWTTWWRISKHPRKYRFRAAGGAGFGRRRSGTVHRAMACSWAFKAAVPKRALGKDSVHRRACRDPGRSAASAAGLPEACSTEEGAKLTRGGRECGPCGGARSQSELGEREAVAGSDQILTREAADVISPNALGAILTEESIAALQTPHLLRAARITSSRHRQDGDRNPWQSAASSMRPIM